MTGATIGTPAYMSPEQCAAKRDLTGASDQYSLGIVAYEMLAGRPPFAADTTVGLLFAQVHEPPVPITDLRPDCPPDVAAALMRMLAKDPAQRWPDVESAVAALGGAPLTREDPIRAQLASLGQAKGDADVRRLATPVSPLPPTRGTPPRRKTRRVPVAAWAIPVVALLAVGAWWTMRAKPAAVTPVPLAQAPAPPPAPPPAPAPGPPPPTTGAETFQRRGTVPLRDRVRERRDQRTQARVEAAAPVAAVSAERVAIEEEVASFGRALESRNLARVRQVYSGMSPQQAQEWGAFMMNARNLRVNLRITALDVSDREAQAEIDGTYSYEDLQSGRAERRPVSFRATLEGEGTSWRFTSLR
jgi:serine/threonine-protein kinase